MTLRRTPPRFVPARFRTLAWVVLASACSEESPGEVKVSYVLGFSDQCAEFDVMTVRAALGDEEFEEEQMCDPAGELFFASVPAGTWTLAVGAVDPLGFTVLDNGGDEASQRVRVQSGGTTEVSAQLSATPVEINVRWDIRVGNFPAQCTDPMLQTATFRVTAWDTDGAMLLTHDFACDAPATMDGGYRTLEDPDRLVRGSSLRAVTVEPRDDRGQLVGTAPLRFEFEPPGAGRRKYFTALCEDNVCTEGGTPPYDTK